MQGHRATDNVSRTSNTCAGRFAYQDLDRRTMSEIQRKVVKRAKRSSVSKLINAKSDKDAIVGWKTDLIRVTHVFNVRSVGLVCYSLTSSF